MNTDIVGGYQKIQIFLKLFNTQYPDNSFKIKVFLDENYLEETNIKMGEEITYDKIFSLIYTFEKEQYLKFLIISPEESLLNFEVKMTVAKIMGSRNFCVKQKLINESDGFILQIDGKNSIESKMVSKLKIDFNVNNGFGKSNSNSLAYNIDEIFYTLSNFIDHKNYRNVYKSEERYYNLLNFDELVISKDLLYENESDQILIKLYDADFQEISDIHITIEEIKSSYDNIFKKQISYKDNKDMNASNAFNIPELFGSVTIKYSEFTKKTFIDYLYSGIDICLSIGIDFTASNGSPKEKNSLHSFLNNEPNDYERAINSCGHILSYYDSDKIYPVFGFGAQFLGSNIVNHCFNISFNNDPNIQGIDNVISIYRENVMKLNFSGPTYFSPLIKNVIDMIRDNIALDPSKISYNILLILSDGQINDMSQTIDVLVDAAKLPLSVIIVGIGNADFSNMVILGKNYFLIFISYMLFVISYLFFRWR
jgi:hypothetical protein